MVPAVPSYSSGRFVALEERRLGGCLIWRICTYFHETEHIQQYIRHGGGTRCFPSFLQEISDSLVFTDWKQSRPSLIFS